MLGLIYLEISIIGFLENAALTRRQRKDWFAFLFFETIVFEMRSWPTSRR